MPSAESTTKFVAAAFAALCVLALGWLLVSWIVSEITKDRYSLRSGVVEVVHAASQCKAAVAAYYAANRRMPANEREAGCAPGSGNATAAKVADGVVVVSATGALRERLLDRSSGMDFRYTPSCEGGACRGAAILDWDCRAGTTIGTDYLPAACR